MSYRKRGVEGEQFRKLFIGGITHDTTEQDLRDYYGQYGEIVDAVVMVYKGTNRSRGFGFVTYSEPEMVDKAQAARPHIIRDRAVEAKRATPREESNNSASHETTKKLFVAGIKDSMTEQQLQDHFSQFGEVEKVDIIKNSSGQMRGFAFVTFTDYDPVDKAILYRPHDVAGFKLDCRKGLSKDSMRQQNSQRYPGPPPPRYGGPPGSYNYYDGPPPPHSYYGHGGPPPHPRDPYYDPYGYPPRDAWGYGGGGYGEDSWHQGYPPQGPQGRYNDDKADYPPPRESAGSYGSRDYSHPPQGPPSEGRGDPYASGPPAPGAPNQPIKQEEYGSYSSGPGPMRHPHNKQLRQDPYERPPPGGKPAFGARAPY